MTKEREDVAMAVRSYVGDLLKTAPNDAVELLTQILNLTAVTGPPYLQQQLKPKAKPKGDFYKKGGKPIWVKEAFQYLQWKSATVEEIYDVIRNKLRRPVTQNLETGCLWVKRTLSKNRKLYLENNDGTWEYKGGRRSLVPIDEAC